MTDPGDQNVHPPTPRCTDTLDMFGEEAGDRRKKVAEILISVRDGRRAYRIADGAYRADRRGADNE